MKLSQEARDVLQTLDITNLDLRALESLPRSVMQELQLMLTPRMNKYIPHVPTPKQSAFLLLDNLESFYGGAAGGGKSDALLMAGLQYVDVKGYAGIIFRKSYADLVKPGALIDRAKEWLFRFADVRWVDKEKKFEFLKKTEYGWEVWSVLQFGYMENDNDRFNYQGGEYQYIGFDELTHISEVCYNYMFSRLRRLAEVNIPLRVRGASNPPEDDLGTWVYNRFVNPKTRLKDSVFIPAGLDDNPFIDKATYEASLNKLDPVSRDRLRHGNWEIIRKGNMFKRDWFETVDAPPPVRRRVRFWDMASSEAPKKKVRRRSDPDYTVGLLLSEAAGVYYIEDIVRVRKRPKDTNEIQHNTATMDGYTTPQYEEQEPGSSGDTAIDMKARTIFKGFNYRGVRSTGDKVLRASAVSAAAERFHVKIVRGCRFIEEFFNEAEGFPGGLHDDIIDALSGAFAALGILPELYLPHAVLSMHGSYWQEASDDDFLLEQDDHSGYWTM